MSGVLIPRCLGALLFVFTCVSSQFINFKPGFEYLYKYSSTADVKSIGEFHVSAKIGYTNIGETDQGQEIYVRVYSFQLKTKHSNEFISHQCDFSKWFSFVITPQGEIEKVYHPVKDDDEAVAIKKGAAAMFASRLHHSRESVSIPTDEGWTYSVREHGHEGEHNATYTVRPSRQGHVFTKVRDPGHHPVKHATSHYTKTLYYNDDLGTIHTVEVNEKFRAMHKTANGYDPFENTRPVKAVNDFTQMNYPELSALGNGKLEFLTRNKAEKVPNRSAKNVMTSNIHIKEVKRKKRPVDMETHMEHVRGNLTCMRNEPEKGSKTLDKCFGQLTSMLNDLPDHQLEEVAQKYLVEKPKLSRTFKDRSYMLDAIAALTSDISQQILLDLVLNTSSPDSFLVQRLLVHIVNLDNPPIDRVISKLKDLCFDRANAPWSLRSTETYHRIVLTVGVVARRLWDAGRKTEGGEIVRNIENMLGLHDPWMFRKKRAAMTEVEILNEDRWRVILLGSLGNAGLDQSFEMIVSHVNTTNSQWVKRAGIHAMRKFSHERAAHLMLRTALFDEDEKVRYEAMLQYQAHPKAAAIAPLYQQKGHVNGSVFYVDPRDVGMQDIQVHDRHRRSFLDKKWEFRLASPSVDWKKMIGSTKIGASFGLLISNSLDFSISALSGSMKVDVHDEAYARIHLGFMGKNLDFFLARICFKGGASYNLNMLKEFAVDTVKKIVELYDTIKGNAAGAIGTAIELFRQIINGDFSIVDMIESFKNALEELPEKVASVGKKATDAMEVLGQMDDKELPPFTRPARNLVVKVANLYSEVKTSVLAFYNTLMETVTVIIPRAGKTIYKGIQAIIKGFKTFLKDPKQAISSVAGNVVTIGREVMNLFHAVKKTKKALFQFRENPPDWMNLASKVMEIIDLGMEARKSLKAGGAKWLNDTSSEKDTVAAFSKGKTNLVEQKKAVLKMLTGVVDGVMEPLDALKQLGGKFTETFMKVFQIIMDLKDAYNSLKEGYRTARSLIDRVFGPKCHKDFPRTIRQPGGGCPGNGDYPSQLKNGKEYEHDGADVSMAEGSPIVAPFVANIMLSNNPNEVILMPTAGTIRDTEIIITNIKPNDTIQSPDDDTYVETGVHAGQVIGVVANSPCGENSHIHFAMRRSGGAIDPTHYLENRMPMLPNYYQECDDYKLVFKMETIAEDCIICLDGKKEEDTSPARSGGDIPQPADMAASKDPSGAVDAENAKPTSFFSKMKNKVTSVAKKFMSSNSVLKTLFNKASAFFKKFSIRNLKMGSIMDLLELLGLKGSMDKMAEVIKTVKEMIDNKPCFNPHQMTDDQLRAELVDRQEPAQGSREEMIKTLTTPSNSCPLMRLSMPDNLYCTFDDKCLGLECCVHFKLWVFRKTFKVFTRYDPCEVKFHIGAEKFNISFTKADGLGNIGGGIDKKFSTGIKLDIMGGIEMLITFKLEKDETAALVTVGAGFCSQDDHDNCLVHRTLLDEAVTPLPICNSDGSITWPKVDYRSFFDKKSIKKRIQGSARKHAHGVMKKGIDELIEFIPCISRDAPGKTGPCPRPSALTKTLLQNKLKVRGLQTTGTKFQLVKRLKRAQKTCSLQDFTVTLPTIHSKEINKIVYLQLSPSCLRFDTCLEIHLPNSTYKKTVNAYIELDPCKFTVTINFEECTEREILLGFAWGVEKVVDLKGVHIRYKLDRDDFMKVFKVNLGLKVQLGKAKPILDSILIENLEVPIPLCNDSFYLPRSASVKDLANEMGGKLNEEVVEVIFKKMDLDKIFMDGKCSAPPTPSECSWPLPDYKALVPADFKNQIKCQLPDSCFGIQCCAHFSFDAPLFEKPFKTSVPFFMKFNPCKFTVEIGFGTYHHNETLLTYNWGTEMSLEIGSGKPAPIQIKFTISKYPKGFLLDLVAHTCIMIDEDKYCYPKEGMHLLKQQKVPSCDAKDMVEFSKQDFSLSDWLSENNLESNETLSQAATTMLLEKFGVSKYLQNKRCDVSRPPYSPHVDGWRNECPKSIHKLPRLPKGLYCHLADTCSKITCCFDVPFLGTSFNAVLDVNMCNYTIYAAIENKTTFINILGEKMDLNAGVTRAFDIVNVFQFKFGIKKKKKALALDLDLKVCFEEGTCMQSLEVLKGTEIPQLVCKLDASINLRNFSISDWAKVRGQDVSKGLQEDAVDLLLQQLGMSDKMLEHPCDRKSLKYLPADQSNWKSDCKQTSGALSLPPISLPANCYINDKCLGIDCCMHSDVINHNVHVTYNIDLCNFVIEGSIETFSFKHDILDYKWGTKKEVTLDGVPVIRLNYKINRLSSQQIFIVDLTANICMEGGSCGFKLKVMDQTRLPMPDCPKSKGFKVPDFSLTEWLKDNGGAMTAELSAKLMEELGIKHFLSNKQCQSHMEPYRGAVNGWKNDCQGMKLPNLKPKVFCHLSDYCTGVTCCAEVSEVKRNFNAHVFIDSCNDNLRVGIEKLEFTHTLSDYKWGEREVMDMGGLFKMEYTITSGERRFLVDLNLKVCFTAGKDCQVTLPIFEGMVLNKPQCDFEESKELTDFSLTEFVKLHGVVLSDQLPNDLVDKLLDTLSVTSYLMETPCSLTDRSSNGWKSACSKSIPLATLPETLSCSIPGRCTALDCCLNVPLISKQIQFKVDVDMCKMTLTLSIEKLEFKTLLFKYKWGNPNSFHLKKIFRADYIIDNLEAEKELIVSLNISACFEAGKSCHSSIPVLKHARFPKPVCDWNSTLSLRGFSLSEWQKENKLIPGQALTAAFRFQLAVALGISQYLLDRSCVRQEGIYKAGKSGWNNACPKAVDQPSLPDSVSCHVPDYCTGLDCCVSVDSLGMSFNFRILLDTRNRVLTVGIEKLQFRTSLFNYKWGEWNHFNLNGVVRLGFKIDDLHHAWKYLLSVKLALCFEANKPCILDVPVFTDVSLPKLIWNWDNPFASVGNGFSLKSWLKQMNLPSEKSITGVYLSKLMNYMGITSFMKNPQCSRLQTPYKGAANGWKKDCSASMNLPSLPHSTVCYLSNPCGTVECCIDVGIIKRSVNVKIGIDPCTFTFTMGIEKLIFTRALSYYKFGKVEHFNLKDFVRIEFMIDDLYGDKMFLINMKAKVCFEKDSCVQTIPILEDVKIPKLTCNWHSTAALSGFSMSDFLTEMKATGLKKLTKPIAAKLFERLEIGGYLQTQQCQPDGSLYSPATNGWKNDCPASTLNQYLTKLPNSMACHVPDTCTAFDCCVDVDFLSHAFHMILKVDMCNYQLTVGVEKMVYKHMLFDYKWGEEDHFYVKGVIRIDYKINRILSKRKLELTASLSVCLKKDDCLFSKQILDKALIPQPFCDWEAIHKSRDFSLSKWASDKGISSIDSSLTHTLVSELLDDLGVSQYLESPGCNQQSSPYDAVNVHNWKQDCNAMTVSSLPDSVKCHLASSCTAVDCCVEVPLVKHTMHAKFDLDMCRLEITMKIEKLTYKTSLLNYNWGSTGYFLIGSMTRLTYKIEHKPASQKLIMDMNIKVCYEKDSCALDIPIFSKSELVYSPCNPSLPVPFKGVSFDVWKPEKCELEDLKPACSTSLPDSVGSVCQMMDNCMGIRCCIDVDLDYLGKYTTTATIMVDHCNDKLIYTVENKEWTKKLKAIGYDKNHTESIGNAITVSYLISKTSVLYKVSFNIKICVVNVNDLTENCYYHKLLDGVKITLPPSCDDTNRKKRSVLDAAMKGDWKGALKDALKRNFTNGQLGELFDKFKKEQNAKERLDSLGFATNPRSAIRKMGLSNPGTILYSKEVGPGKVTVGLEGGEKIMKILGQVTDILGRGDQAYTVGKGLTGKGLDLLGAKLANMSIGEMIAMFDTKNIDPELVLKLLRQLRDLGQALYNDIVDAVLNGGASDTFGSFDLTIQGDFSFPRQSIMFFEFEKFFLIGGIVPMTFKFGAGCSYGMGVLVGAKILGMTAFGQVVPYGGVHVYGELGIGFILYGKLRFDGYILNLAFPSRAEIGFYKFPLDLSLTMDMELIPFEMTLRGLVTLEINLLFTSFKKTLFSAQIYRYATPIIRKRILSVGKKEKDESPPQFLNYMTEGKKRRKREVSSTRSCLVRQLAGRDYTEPAVEIAVAAQDDKSRVQLYVDAGTRPGLSDVLNRANLGGDSTIITQKFSKHGVPMFFTVFGENSAGARTSVTCSIPTYDISIPGGRMTADFATSSNPAEIRGHVVVYEDSDLVTSSVGVGLGKGIYADEIIAFNPVDLKHRDNKYYNPSTDLVGFGALEHFAGAKQGRLIGPVISEFFNFNHIGSCVKECMKYPETKCMSVNYDYGPRGHCELLEVIEGHHYKVSISGQYAHFERIGVGLAYEFIYKGLSLHQNAMYYFNMHLTNVLGFESILHSTGVVVDVTPPEPGPLANVSLDTMEVAPCRSIVPRDRKDWLERCKGVNPKVKNHRIIIDGPGSGTLFNGDTPLTDLKYTRANRYISANWDGIEDKETRLLGYSWTVGKKICEELIHPHHDPHKHLFDKSEWTNSGLIAPLPDPYDPLPDGVYYITLRALNKIDFGGPLVTSICHTSPLIVDNSPPVLHEIYNISYDEETYVISAMYNFSDPDSGIREMDLCLGETPRDCYHMEWQRSPYEDGSLTRTYEIPGGTPVWIKLRAVNRVDLTRSAVADHPIIIDTSPPVAGEVYDGPIYKCDLNFTKDADKICGNWFGFYDEESGISYYEIFVLDENGTRVSEPVTVDYKTHETCVDLPSDKLLEHGKTYVFHVTAFNAAHRQQNVSAESNGVNVDLTPPVQGEIVDGRLENFQDQEYSTSVATVGTQWRGYSDPESKVRQYSVKVLRAKDLGSDFEVLRDWKTLSKDTSEIEWHNFDLSHRDIVKTSLLTTNNALGSVEKKTSGFVVDLTPPTMTFLGDGAEAGKDTEFQQSTTTLEANFVFIDEESNLDHFKYQIYEQYHGRKNQIYPLSGWENIDDSTSTTLTQSALNLKLGAMYSIRVGAVNKAGSMAAYDTNGVLLDNTKPKMSWVYVGIFSGSDEPAIDGYVIQSDSSGIKATWFGTDYQSRIKSYLIAVGTTAGGTDTLDWIDVGAERDRYIDKLSLTVTDPKTNSPVYYVSVKATNGAGLTSDAVTSTPIRVVKQDKAGLVIDGAESTEKADYMGVGVDMDYQREAGLVTVQFAGFESHEHGVIHYDWAVGTTPGGEDVQPFIKAGLIHKESETDVPGNGIASMGFGQAVLPLVAGTKYYTTVRGITNTGNILQSTSDGFTVDRSPPSVDIESFAKENNKTELTPETKLYQSETDSMSSSWMAADKESPVKKMFYSVGTYPHGEDVQPKTEIDLMLTGEGALPTGTKPSTDGKPNIVTLTAVNEVGLTTSVISPSLVVDVTAPTEGVVRCPSFVQPHSAVECTWEGFYDAESNIEEFEFAVGSHEGLEDVISPVKLTGSTAKYLIHGLGDKVTHGQKYFAKVKAINTVGKTSSSISNSISVDSTPPVVGTVVELSTAYVINITDEIITEKLNKYRCDSEKECLAIDAVCQESLSSVFIAWQAFTDKETEIVKYEVAVGTTPGGGQLRGFFEVEDITQRYLAITGLILKGERQVFVTVKGTNGAGLSSISASNGVYMSYLSQGLEPLSHVGVWDGNDPEGDLNFQTHLTRLDARWDVSGDPCPVTKYEWAIQRADGLRVQDYVDMIGRTHGTNDQLSMKNKERYYQYLRVTNSLNYTYTIRSNGITIEEDPLVPGQVNDGDVIGFDLEFLRTKSKISANWDKFGSDGIKQEEGIRAANVMPEEDATKSSSQEVAFYEVAVGTDRRFANTRDNVVPFTNVGMDKSVTFFDLDLIPLTATYYFTVRAHSKSGSRSEVTSNGFSVGFNGGVEAGVITMKDYINSNTSFDVSWDEFESKIGMMMYYVGLSDSTDAENYTCGEYTERGSVTDEERQTIFNVVDISNVGKDTFMKFEDLSLKQNGVYYVWVIGADNSGKCNMTSYSFTVDVTPPLEGKIRNGPYYDLKLGYTVSRERLEIFWKDFTDDESGLRCYHASLYKKSSCAKTASEEMVMASIEVDANYTSYKFMDLDMQGNTPYVAHVVAENKAGLRTLVKSPPILFDNSNPSPGVVIDGHDFTMDVSWIGSKDTVEGTFLHHPESDKSPCPSRHIQFNDKDWKSLDTNRIYDSSNRSLSLTYKNAYIHPDSGFVDIKLARDSKTDSMFSGAYYRDADLVNGGEYKMSIRAAGGDGKVVTSIIFWDGSEDNILDYDFTAKPHWSKSVCDCCLETAVNPSTCKCNCERYFASKDYYRNITKRSIADNVPVKPTVDDVPRKSIAADIPSRSIVDVPKKAIVDDVPKKAIVDDVPKKAIVDDVPKKAILDDVAKKTIIDDVPKKTIVDDVAKKSTDDDIPEMAIDNDVPKFIVADVPTIGDEVLKKSVVDDVPKKSIVDDVPKKSIAVDVPKKITVNVPRTSDDVPMRSIIDEVPAYTIKKLTKDEKRRLRIIGTLKDNNIGVPDLTPKKSCGLQIFAGLEKSKSKIVSWCRFGDYLNEPLETVKEVDMDLSQDYHDYVIKLTTQMDEARSSEITWCMMISLDGDMISEQCGVPRLSPETKLYLTVWNHKNFIPDMERDDKGHMMAWSTTASFRDLVMPPEKEKLCRYGNPFQGGNNAIVRYEAAIGSASGLSDVVDFQQVYTPCIPCLTPCDFYTCDPTCDKSKTEQVKITLNDLNLKETKLINGEIQPIIYYLTVKAVLGSGKSALASSDGFNIDTTAPVFMEEVMLYMDVMQGKFTPVTFQGSNDTIKAVWKCSDNESEIVNYEWSIGVEPGGQEIQNFTSAGEFPGANNSRLEGVLEDNTTYYVTVRCTNGGGLITEYADTKGVTVLLTPPNIDDVNATIQGAEPLGTLVVPPNSMATKKKHTVGASWTVAKDPSVRRYDFCVSSANDSSCDIFPWTWVGYNQSGTVSVEDGYLKLNGQNLYKLSQYKPGYDGSADEPTDKTAFTMAPGRLMFIFMKLCNEAMLCTKKLLGTTIVETETSQLATSPDGSSISVGIKPRGPRIKRDLSDVSVKTPSGLQAGQSIVVTELSDKDLQTVYKSDASVDFVPYITNPDTTTNDDAFLNRLLKQRLRYVKTDSSFSVSSIGGLPMPGPLIVSFTDHSPDINHTQVLLHWNPGAKQWQQSKKSCEFESDTEVRNRASRRVTVKVCDTRSPENTLNSNSSVSEKYFQHATQFLITTAVRIIINDPPELTSPTGISMEEDGGTLIYQLIAIDPDEDMFKFKINPQFTGTNIDVALSDSGLLTYTPAADYAGRVTVPVILYEVDLEEIPPASVPLNINIDVSSINDAPVAFAFSNQASILHPDPTHPVIIHLEQIRTNDSLSTVYTWNFGVYDVDKGDNMTVYNTMPSNGTLTVGEDKNVPCSAQSGIPCEKLSLSHPASFHTWKYRTFSYQPDTDFYGFDEVRVYAQDQVGVYSDIVTLRFAVMERPCQNGGTCKSRDEDKYSCEHYRRAESFDLHYTCECAPGWTGIHCEDDIDECYSSPCSWPYSCYNELAQYRCACPESHPNCDGIQAWMIALIVVGIILLIILSLLVYLVLMVKRGRLTWSTLWQRIVGKSGGKRVGTSFYNQGFADDNNDLCGDLKGPMTTKPEGASWGIYTGNLLSDGIPALEKEKPLQLVDPHHKQTDTKTNQAVVTTLGQVNGGMSSEIPSKSTHPAFHRNVSNISNVSNTSMDRSMTPVEVDRPSSSEALIRPRTPQKNKTKLILVNQPPLDSEI